jgi:hypothetical protein
MEKCKTLLASLFFSLFLVNSFAQGTAVYLSINSATIGNVVIDSSFSDSVVIAPSNNETLNANIVNVGNQVFTGQLSLGVKISNDSVSNQLVSYIDTVSAQQLQPGLSSIYGFPNFGLPNTGLQLRIGGNVVVVWPVAVNSANTVVAVDSLSFNLFIGDTANSVLYRTFQEKYIIYPNPASHYLYIQLDENRPENGIESIEILGLDGRSERRFENQTEKIDLQGISKGLHLVKVFEKNGSVYTFKIFLN